MSGAAADVFVFQVFSVKENFTAVGRLKAADQLEWVRQMNACVAQAEEVIKDELIYS